MKIKLTTYEPPADLPACCICDFHTVEYYDESGNITGKAYCGISEQGAATYKVKAVYIDDDAKRFLWRQNFDRLDNTDRKAILAVFPDILQKDAATLKTVTDYEYKYNFWTGDFVLVPNVHTETVPEKYEVLYFVTYDNGDTSHCWEAVNKAEYDAAVAFLEMQTKGGGQ